MPAIGRWDHQTPATVTARADRVVSGRSRTPVWGDDGLAKWAGRSPVLRPEGKVAKKRLKRLKSPGRKPY